jgi:hypothetical protein
MEYLAREAQQQAGEARREAKQEVGGERDGFHAGHYSNRGRGWQQRAARA